MERGMMFTFAQERDSIEKCSGIKKISKKRFF